MNNYMPIKWTTYKKNGQILRKVQFPKTEPGRNFLKYMNSWVTISETESVILKFPTNKNPGLDGFTDESYQTFREELMPRLLKLF